MEVSFVNFTKHYKCKDQDTYVPQEIVAFVIENYIFAEIKLNISCSAFIDRPKVSCITTTDFSDTTFEILHGFLKILF